MPVPGQQSDYPHCLADGGHSVLVTELSSMGIKVPSSTMDETPSIELYLQSLFVFKA